MPDYSRDVRLWIRQTVRLRLPTFLHLEGCFQLRWQSLSFRFKLLRPQQQRRIRNTANVPCGYLWFEITYDFSKSTNIHRNVFLYKSGPLANYSITFPGTQSGNNFQIAVLRENEHTGVYQGIGTSFMIISIVGSYPMGPGEPNDNSNCGWMTSSLTFHFADTPCNSEPARVICK